MDEEKIGSEVSVSALFGGMGWGSKKFPGLSSYSDARSSTTAPQENSREFLFFLSSQIVLTSEFTI